MAKIVINTELDTKSFDKQIAKLESDIKRYTNVLESDAQIPVSLRMSQQERQELEVLVEKLRNQLVDLKNKAKDVGDVGEEAGEKSGKGFEKGLKSLKKFGMALLGVRGLFTLVRRATNSYLNEHQDTANKLNAIWVALGNALGPIIEIIADGVLQLIGYLNVFLQALGFDVDLTKNMNKSTKAIQGTTSAMKELNRETYSFDEMNKQSKDTSVGGGGGGAGADNGFKMPELNEGIVKLLKETAKFLKENWEWLTAIAGVLIGASWISKLTGAGGLISGLKTLATIGVVVAGVNLLYNAITGRDLIKDLGEIINHLKTMPEFSEKITEENKKNTQENKNWLDTMKEQISTWQKGSKEVTNHFNKLKYDNKAYAENNKEIVKNVKEMSGLEWGLQRLDGSEERYNNTISQNTYKMRDNVRQMYIMYQQGLLNDDQTKIFRETLNALGGTIDENGIKFKDFTVDVNKQQHEMEVYDDILNATNGTLEKGSTIWEHYGTGMQFSGTSGRFFGKSMTENVIDTLVNASKKAVVLKDDLNVLGNVTATPEIKLKSNVNQIKADIQSLGTIIANIAGNFTITTKKFFGLAKGGIVNNPGKGVTMSGVITGEATNGAEGVIPMNNDEVMDLLGQKIARHIQINLTNNTMLDSRVIAREQTKIASDMNFLTNGRGV